jgi:predicted dehydrogenase
LDNFRAIGAGPISLFRTGNSTVAGDYGDNVAVYSSLPEALAANPVGVIVANPTSLHLSTSLAAAGAGCHLFIEKPISHNLESVQELEGLAESRQLIVVVGYQYRHHPGLASVKDLVAAGEIGQIISAHAKWAEYLPNWHPWEDYRTSYSARRDLGGGVILTLSHVFDYLRWLFGEVVRVSACCQEGLLGIQAEEVCAGTLRFENGILAQFYLDYIGQPPAHILEITGSEGRIIWTPDGPTQLYKKRTGTWIHQNLPSGYTRNAMFLAEALNFLQSISRVAEPMCCLQDGIAALRIAAAAKASCDRGGAPVDVQCI